jgi:hypothetical protein
VHSNLHLTEIYVQSESSQAVDIRHDVNSAGKVTESFSFPLAFKADAVDKPL